MDRDSDAGDIRAVVWELKAIRLELGKLRQELRASRTEGTTERVATKPMKRLELNPRLETDVQWATLTSPLLDRLATLGTAIQEHLDGEEIPVKDDSGRIFYQDPLASIGLAIQAHLDGKPNPVRQNCAEAEEITLTTLGDLG